MRLFTRASLIAFVFVWQESKATDVPLSISDYNWEAAEKTKKKSTCTFKETNERNCLTMDDADFASIDKATWQSFSNQTNEFKRIIRIFYQTIYSGNPAQTSVSATEKKKTDFLKRLFFALDFLGLQLIKKTCTNGICTDGRKREDQEKERKEPWPYPLAIALGGGIRVLFENYGVSSNKVFKWLLTGNEKGNNKDISEPRTFASHGAVQEKRKIFELKLDGVSGTASNLKHGLLGHHHMVNIAFGGIGNKDLNDQEILAGGTRKTPKIQHGSVYIFKDDFKYGNSALVLGIEENAPLTKSMIGYSHDITSGLKSTANNPTVTNGPRMTKLLGKNNAPLEYGGMTVQMNPEKFLQLKEAWKAFIALDEEKQKTTMKDILRCSADIAKVKGERSCTLGAGNESSEEK